MTKRKTHRKRGTLPVIAGLLLASALLRAGDEVGRANAQNVPLESATIVEQSVQKDSSEISAEPGTLLAALQTREANLVRREQALIDRMQALEVMESEVAEQLAALQDAENALRSTIALADEAAETDLLRLATVYENMKPKEAAALFEQMEPAFAAGFLGMMRPDIAATVMTQLEPETAYSISVVMAGRNVGVPTE